MTNFIYLLYGTNEDCFNEAAYSIGTLRRRLDAASSRIIVFTDRPEKVKDWPVECDSIAGELPAMRGKADFSHRAKLGVIAKCFEKYPGDVFYLDSDTSVHGDIAGMAGQLAAGTAIMYRFECLNPEIGLAGFHTVLTGAIPYRFSPASHMYNAGVIALHRDNRAVVGLALELCDAILETGNRVHTAEQFSVGEALRISGIKILEARGVIRHYIQHKYYIRSKIDGQMRRTGRPPWDFARPIPYSRTKVYWLRKFGRYLN